MKRMSQNWKLNWKIWHNMLILCGFNNIIIFIIIELECVVSEISNKYFVHFYEPMRSEKKK